MPDGAALLAWAFREQFVAAVEAEIDRRADPAAALSTEQRAERLAAIEAEADTIERREVATIWARRDLTLFRPETDPARLLGVAYVENDHD